MAAEEQAVDEDIDARDIQVTNKTKGRLFYSLCLYSFLGIDQHRGCFSRRRTRYCVFLCSLTHTLGEALSLLSEKKKQEGEHCCNPLMWHIC